MSNKRIEEIENIIKEVQKLDMTTPEGVRMHGILQSILILMQGMQTEIDQLQYDQSQNRHYFSPAPQLSPPHYISPTYWPRPMEVWCTNSTSGEMK